MVVKKKSKSNRGRPRKEFKPRHKRLEEKAMTVPQLVEHKIPKYERILRIPSKDKSIFYLFIFSIVLFLCSLVISFIKKHDVKILQENTAGIIAQTGAETQENQVPMGGITQTVENMYGVINSKSFDELSNYWDVSLKNSNTVRTYFNDKRLTRFIEHTINGGIVISNVKQEQIKDYSWKVTYTLVYTLSDNQVFTEDRSATVIKRDETYSIATIKCETTGCSRMPFFNPGKYDIK